jgi:hypothetical protein
MFKSLGSVSQESKVAKKTFYTPVRDTVSPLSRPSSKASRPFTSTGMNKTDLKKEQQKHRPSKTQTSFKFNNTT